MIAAGNDLAAFTFGSFNANLSAGHDVLGVTSVGDLLGTITASHSISGDIRSFGGINATMQASGSPGGAISSVVATDDIEGMISAAGALGEIRAGGDILATIRGRQRCQEPFHSQRQRCQEPFHSQRQRCQEPFHNIGS